MLYTLRTSCYRLDQTRCWGDRPDQACCGCDNFHWHNSYSKREWCS